MATVYINLYDHLNIVPHLPARLYANQYLVECLKGQAPDDGEAMGHSIKFRVECPDEDWREVLEILQDSGKSLVYSVVMQAANGEAVVREAGEMNSSVQHYTTRLGNAKQLFAFWFGDEMPLQPMRLAA